jgi:hypothetical protein
MAKSKDEEIKKITPDKENNEGDKGNEDKDKTSGTSPSDAKIAELEKKLGAMGEEWGQAREFINGASTVINTIAFNPELREKFQTTYKQNMVAGREGAGQQQGEDKAKKTTVTPSKGEGEELTRTVRDVEVSQRESIIRDFETRYGIDKLKDEERKEARRKIESHFNQWGQSVKNAPLSALDSQLDSAYVSTHAQKLREEGKLEGITQARGNALGTMGSFGGGVPDRGDTKELTPKQKEWAKKLNVDEDKATKRYFSDNEEK